MVRAEVEDRARRTELVAMGRIRVAAGGKAVAPRRVAQEVPNRFGLPKESTMKLS